MRWFVKAMHNLSRPGAVLQEGDLVEVETEGGFLVETEGGFELEVDPRRRRTRRVHQRFRVRRLTTEQWVGGRRRDCDLEIVARR